MNVKILTDDKLLDKIDEVKKRIGIDVSKYSTAIDLICDSVLDDLELKEKYLNAMEYLFTECSSGGSDISSDAMKDCIMVYKSITG